jgi:3-oxoacyl-[acyl-carrier protein] reductase
MRFEEKVAIVTGGGQGIGKAVARGLASEGASVVISDINSEIAHKTAEEVEESYQAKALAVKTDVKKRDDIHNLVAFAESEFGRIDILFNSAGICKRIDIQDISEEVWDEMIDINLRGVFLCSQAVMPIMKRQQQGRILNMASLAGKVGGIAVGAHYSASKAGVICLTKSFARALGPHGVTVNALAPGPVDTAMIQDWPPEVREDMARQSPLGRIAQTEDIVEPALFLLSDAARHITGATLDINGGILMD